MLLGNYQVLNRSPGRFLGGSSLAANPPNWYGSGAARNFGLQWNTTTADKLYGMPNGTEAPYSYLMPLRSGQLASTTLITGNGNVATGNLAMGLACDGALTGSGDITAAGLGLIVSMLADLAGTGTLTADLQAFLALAATLSGSGDLTGALTALGHFVAGLTGTGEITLATMNGKSSMEAEISVTGELLTTATVASAVWGAIADSGFTYEEVIRIIAAATAGVSTGGPSSPVFKALDGTTTIISGSANSSGNRSSITYTP